MKIRKRDVEDFWQFMTTHYHTKVIQKSNLNQIIEGVVENTVENKDNLIDYMKKSGLEMNVAAILMEKLDIIDMDYFMNNFATTIGDRIYLPFDIGDASSGRDLASQMRTCIHEHQHVVQYRKEEFAFMLRYLDPAQRALFEADAYTCNLEFDFFIKGVEPSTDRCWGYANRLAHYRCSEENIRVAAKALKSNAVTIRAGGLGTAAGKIGIPWIKKRCS